MKIVLSDVISGTNADLLNSTRLQTVPAGGLLTFEFQAQLSTSSNRFTVTIQLPNGDTPFNQVLVPGSNPALEGVIDDRQKIQYSAPVPQGGHVVVTLTETGTTTCAYRISYTGPSL